MHEVSRLHGLDIVVLIALGGVVPPRWGHPDSGIELLLIELIDMVVENGQTVLLRD